MTLTNRIQNLMQALCQEFPERQDRLQLGFLAAINNESFYLYGRSGSGKNFMINRLLSAFKKTNILKIDSRPQELPTSLEAYDVIWFKEFNPIDDLTKNNVRNALQNRLNTTLILSSDVRPENAMGRADIADDITLTIYMPDNLSSDALCMLLQNHSLNDSFKVPEEYTISDEEKKQWAEEIKNVVLSSDTMTIIGKLSELCIENAIYVPISKWLSLANIARTIAFFNGRKETTFSDALFLGTSIWGRSTSNNVIMDNFNSIVKSVMFKDLASAVETTYDANALYRKVKGLLNSSNNLYETKEFNGEPCICYRITVAGEQTPLYVPLHYVETNEDFNPYNELRKVEKHIRCNYHGTSSCTISIDSAVKGVGLRNNNSRNSNNTPEKFEDFATLPTYILRENDPEVAKKKRIELEACQKEAQTQMEQQAKILRSLRDLYQSNKTFRNDLFCNLEIFDKIQSDLSDIFNTINGIATKLKETLELYNTSKA
jgi:MoxR-like ATPase